MHDQRTGFCGSALLAVSILFMTIQCIGYLSSVRSPQPANNHISAGISAGLTEIQSTFNEIKDFFSGIKSFFEKIASFTSFIGFGTFVLLLVVFIFSSGLSAIGIPRGRTAFFISLALADSLWILWKESFAHQSPAYLLPLFRANAILLIPYMGTLVAKKLFPLFMMRLKKLFIRKRKISCDLLLHLTEEIYRAFSDFQQQSHRDVLDAKERGILIMSPETIETFDRLQEIITKNDLRKILDKK
jgi:hypothetical protein